MHMTQHTSASQVSKLRSLVSLGGRHLYLPSLVTNTWLLSFFLHIFLSYCREVSAQREAPFSSTAQSSPYIQVRPSNGFSQRKEEKGAWWSVLVLYPLQAVRTRFLGPINVCNYRQKRTLGSWSLMRLGETERLLMRNVSDCGQGKASCRCVRLLSTGGGNIGCNK